MLTALALVIAAGALVGQIQLVGGSTASAQGRPLSGEEAHRLASMRQANHDDGQAGIRITISDSSEVIHLIGWIDWRHPTVYLAQSSSGHSPAADSSRLLQAVPGLVGFHDLRPEVAGHAAGDSRTHATSATAAAAGPPPPRQPPSDGWRVRALGSEGEPARPSEPGTLDAVLYLLLASTSTQVDSAAVLAQSDARWLGHDRVAGTKVDILLGPAVPPAQPSQPAQPAAGPNRSLAGMGGAVHYWLDARARLHRMEALLTEQTNLQIDFDRRDRTWPPVVVAPLGGAAIDPRPVTAGEAEMLASLRTRNHEVGGGRVTLWLPTKGGGARNADGWLDWRYRFAYLATYRNGAPDALLWADRSGMSYRSDLLPHAGLPPLPPPADGGWRSEPWPESGTGDELQLLLDEALSLGAWQGEEPGRFREVARWLRADTLAGTPVEVFEVPRAAEVGLPPGQARLRYWVAEPSGVLLRLEVRTDSGGFGHLDLTPEPLPALSSAGFS